MSDEVNLLEFVELLKYGARHGRTDREHLKSAHDHIAAMVDSVCCTQREVTPDETVPPDGQHEEPGMGPIGFTGKANARHASVDLDRIKKVHDLLVELGATCPKLKETNE